MSIPKNILKEHLLKAIDKIDQEGIPKDGDSQYYDVAYNGRRYPPKLVVAYANIFANGKELDRNSFTGGVETQCFKLLEERDFLILKKDVNHYALSASWKGNDEGSDQTERFIANGIWENGYQDKFLDIVKGVNKGDRVVIKSSYATKEGKSILRIKAIGTVYENKGDGRILRINWETRFTPFDLIGYGSYRNTIQKIADSDIAAIFKKQNMISYYGELSKFLAQAKTNDLGTSEYLDSFQGLNVKVSFGKGNQARIPWIAFLNEIDTVQEGIYPVYLLYKEKGLLILAYGVSEAMQSNRVWTISDKKSITEYFKERKFSSPERYGSSFVFKVYDVSNKISETEINRDLDELIAVYKDSYKGIIKSANSTDNFIAEYVIDSIRNSQLFFSKSTILRFITSLLTKPFVILTGLSGSGKTKLAHAFVSIICEDESQYCLVPVGADWTNREPLLGFPNSLQTASYVKPENGVLDLIIESNRNSDKPYFLILDEMNLSHVERYFADFLSVMESKGEISLHADDKLWNGVPSKLLFPSNLFIIGTVNIDETTYMFSPKVLDRANVIEFRVTGDEMKAYLGSSSSVDLKAIAGAGSGMAASFVSLAKNPMEAPDNIEQFKEALLTFFNELKKAGAEFGYRSASEIIRFAGVVKKLNVGWSQDQVLDVAVMQKLLPKVHGSRRKLEPVLQKLAALCVIDSKDVALLNNSIISEEDLKKIKYPISFEKLHRMNQNLVANGFTSYAEA